MSKPLLIAEKPDMGRKIAAALAKPHKNGQGYIETDEAIVTWGVGHIMKAYEPHEYDEKWKKWSFDTLPIIVPEWKIKVDEKKASQFKVIKELLSKASSVINAGDPGREGQLIVDEILHYLKNKKPVQRILLHALDAKSIRTAWNNMVDNKKFYPLYLAGVCRGYADFTMGMNGTRVYTLNAQKKGYKGVLSIGRVQTPTLAIVVKRDLEIDNFVPHDYFVLLGQFENNGNTFNAYWKPNDSTPANWLDDEKRLINKQAAIDIAQKIKNKQGVVKDYEENDGKEYAPLPFSLSKLQIYANSKWGMSAKKVLDLCQALYEKHELQTYPRTDCQYLPEVEFANSKTVLNHISASTPDLANAVNGANTSLKSSAWDDTKLSDHYGLMPTQKQADLSLLTDDEKKIYRAVCERYIAQFYPPCDFRTANVTIECEQEIFKATGKVIINLGWRKIFSNMDEEEETKNDEESQIFPELQKGDSVNCYDVKCTAKKTTPPPRFTEGTLIKAMTNVHTLVDNIEQKKKLKEKKGIGQEATRTSILESLFSHSLLLKEGKKIISSDAGKALIAAVPKKVTDPALTAIWEDALDKIAEGKLSADVFMQKQNEWIIQLIKEAQSAEINISSYASNNVSSNNKISLGNNNQNSGSAQQKPATKKASGGGKTCPKCNVGKMVERTAKASGKKFLGCNNWPKCDHVEWPKK